MLNQRKRKHKDPINRLKLMNLSQTVNKYTENIGKIKVVVNL